MKNKFLVMLALMLTVLASVAFASQEVIEVKLNDKYIDFTDDQGNVVNPELINDRTMVPMRKIFEALGADIMWDGATQRVTATTAEKEITLQINNTEASVKSLETEETDTIKLDSAPVILNDRTMVPVRFIAESLEKQVGWDAKNRVVVIIDYSEILEDLKENCSTLLEMANEQTVEVNSFDTTINISGNLNYKDTENSKNNEKLTISGTLDVKRGEELAEVIANLKITGNGSLYNAIKDAGYNKIAFDVIFDLKNNEAYVKSSLLGSNKWQKGSADFSNLLTTANGNGKTFEEFFVLPEEELTKDSYDELKLTVAVFKALGGNDRIKVSGKSTKTYTMKWGLEDILKTLGYDSENIQELLSLGTATMEISLTYKDGMNTKGKYSIDISLQMKESKEKVTASVSGDMKINSYNKSVKITLPKASEIEETENVYTLSKVTK
ncbi:MAG: copper amine oxidase N-terminal domain-containing protein [Clostridia bacterium]|nr:copper amine oxidase N-terminal domain-containing protein [Clostridia bacterium]